MDNYEFYEEIDLLWMFDIEDVVKSDHNIDIGSNSVGLRVKRW